MNQDYIELSAGIDKNDLNVILLDRLNGTYVLLREKMTGTGRIYCQQVSSYTSSIQAGCAFDRAVRGGKVYHYGN